MDGGSYENVHHSSKESSAKLLYELLTSFCELAATCNLTTASRNLRVSRQTLRRHVEQLESLRGVQLFVLKDRTYELTPEGRSALPVARRMLADSHRFLLGTGGSSQFLPKLKGEGPKDFYYIQERQPISSVWDKSSGLFRGSIRGWSEASGDIEHPSMTLVRDRSLICRINGGSWICTEVGDKSFYSKWWGWAKARSSVGCTLEKFPLGSKVGEILERSYGEVSASMGFVLDQVATKAPRTGYEGTQPMLFDRLVLGVRFPDKSRGIMIIVDGAETIDIEADGYQLVMPSDEVRVDDLT